MAYRSDFDWEGDRHPEIPIEELRAGLAAETGENIVVRRFARFAVGG